MLIWIIHTYILLKLNSNHCNYLGFREKKWICEKHYHGLWELLVQNNFYLALLFLQISRGDAPSQWLHPRQNVPITSFSAWKVFNPKLKKAIKPPLFVCDIYVYYIPHCIESNNDIVAL